MNPSDRFMSVTEGCIKGDKQDREWYQSVSNPLWNTVSKIKSEALLPSLELDTCTAQNWLHPHQGAAPLHSSETSSILWLDPWGFILQWDNEPKHTSKLWHNYWRSEETEESSTVSWPQPHSTFMGTLQLRKPNTLWHHKKLCGTLVKSCRGNMSQHVLH